MSKTIQGEHAGAPVVLRAEGLCKYYAMGPDRLEIIRNCDLAVRKGEFVAIMGKSGSGKSTLLHVLGALDVPQLGQLFFNDHPVFAPSSVRRQTVSALDAFSDAEHRRNDLRRTQFGFVFQFYHLLPELSVLENVLLPRMVATPIWKWRSERPAASQLAFMLLSRVGLGDRLRHRPNQLSGGERQRVAIARALIHRPAILYADEPTGNLDAESGSNIMGILREIHAGGQTMILVTHDPTIAGQADRSLVLESGRLRPSSPKSAPVPEQSATRNGG